MSLDDIDRRIIAELRLDGRMRNADLAARVGLSASACLRRLRQLESSGAIRGYTAIIGNAAASDATIVIVQVSLDQQTEKVMREFEVAVRRCAEVKECYLMAGMTDYLVRVEARDMPDYERIHTAVLSRLPHVARIQSNFAIRKVVT